jgi:hypothetical protein
MHHRVRGRNQKMAQQKIHKIVAPERAL